MQPHELSRVPVTVEHSWTQERSLDARRSFIDSRLAALALHATDEELEIEAELSLVA